MPVFLVMSSYKHCVTENDDFWDLKAKGVSLQDAIIKVMNGEDELRAVSNCDGLDCSETCTLNESATADLT